MIPKNGKLRRRRFLQLTTATGMAAVLGNIEALSTTPTADRSLTRPLCVFSKHLQFLNYTDMAQAARDAGFQGVDLTVRPGGHVLPENALTDFPRAVEAVRKAGLEVYMMTTRITDPEDKNTVPILQTADKLGVRFYRLGYLRYDDKKGVIGSLKSFRPAMAGLAKLNQKYHIHGGYQNHSGTRIGGPVWDLWELLKEVNPEWMGIQYDIRHATVEGGASWPLGLKLLKDYVRIFAIKDFYWNKSDGKWKVQNCPLGKGMVDFKQYFSLVKKLNLTGPVSVHFEYEMPGENDKQMKLSERRRKTVEVMRKDLETLQKMMKDAAI